MAMITIRKHGDVEEGNYQYYSFKNMKHDYPSRCKHLSPGASVCGCGVITGPDGIAADFLACYQFSLLYVVSCNEYIT